MFLGCRWTYADPSWARIAALVPQVVTCAEAGDEISDKILVDAADDLALSVKAVVQRLGLCGKGDFTYPTDCFFYQVCFATRFLNTSELFSLQMGQLLSRL